MIWRREGIPSDLDLKGDILSEEEQKSKQTWGEGNHKRRRMKREDRRMKRGDKGDQCQGVGSMVALTYNPLGLNC